MSINGTITKHDETATSLHWSGRLLTAEDVRISLNGHRQIVLPTRTIVTPLALDDLRTRGIRLVRRNEVRAVTPVIEADWGYAQDRPSGSVSSVVQTVKRDGIHLTEIPAPCGPDISMWAKNLAERVVLGNVKGAVVFCDDPGLVCCVANKRPGLRALAVHNVAAAGRAVLTVAPNLVAIEMPGRTFYELRQMVRTVCTSRLHCPEPLAGMLKEMEAHAHR